MFCNFLCESEQRNYTYVSFRLGVTEGSARFASWYNVTKSVVACVAGKLELEPLTRMKG